MYEYDLLHNTYQFNLPIPLIQEEHLSERNERVGALSTLNLPLSGLSKSSVTRISDSQDIDMSLYIDNIDVKQ